MSNNITGVIQCLQEQIDLLTSKVKQLEGSVGILANAEQYNKERFEAGREMAKYAYEFLSERSTEFHDWYRVKKELGL